MKDYIQNKSLKACFFMALSGAFLIAGYEFVRSPSNSLFKDAYGMANFATALAFMPFAVFAVLFLYGKLLDRYTAKKTLIITNLLSAFVIGTSYLLILSGVKAANIILIIFREAYIVLLVEQLWSFINNTIDTKQARKINGAVLAISTIGALAGDFCVYHLAESLGTKNMLAFSFFCFFPAIFFATVAYQVTPKPADSYKSNIPKAQKRKFTDSLGLSLFKTEPVLFIILFVIISSQLYSTIVTLNLQASLFEHIPNVDAQTAYSAKLFLWLNSLSLSFQIVLVPIVLALIPLHYAHFLIPLLNLVAISIVIYMPSLETAAFAFILFKALDYSLFRAAKEILYIPLSFDAKFRSKELIDVLGYRLTKGLSASVISLVQKFGVVISSVGYGAIGSTAALMWFLFIIPIAQKKAPTKPIKPIKKSLSSKEV